MKIVIGRMNNFELMSVSQIHSFDEELLNMKEREKTEGEREGEKKKRGRKKEEREEEEKKDRRERI